MRKRQHAALGAKAPRSVTPAQALARLRRAMPAAVARVLRVLTASGGHPVVVGGAVRDVFCHAVPKDWDIAVDLPVARIAEAFDRVARHGEKHGTVMVIVQGLPVEVSTLRAPKGVSWAAALHEDLEHRDFTMNAMAADLHADALLDPFGGAADLARGLLRGVSDPVARIREDPLRALRAARLVAERGFKVEARTRAALVTAPLEALAAERQREEVLRILAASDPAAGFRLLARAGILPRLLPALAPLTRTCWLRLCEIVGTKPYERWVFWAWCHGCEAARFQAQLVGLRVNRAEALRAAQILAALAPLAPRRAPRGAALRHWMAARPAVAVTAAALAELRWPQGYRGFAAATVHEQQHACVSLAQLAVNGDVLLQHGIAPKHIGHTLRALLHWVCDAPSRNERRLLLARAAGSTLF